MLLETAESAVGRPEIVAPLRDAVRLIHHQHGNGTIRQHFFQPSVECLGRDVHHFVLSPLESVQLFQPLLSPQRGIDGGRREAEGREGIDLILHQADQGRQYQDRSREDACRNLEGERFARTGRHDGDAVSSCEDGLDDLLLSRPECVVAEDVSQNVGSGADLWSGWAWRHVRQSNRPDPQ